MSSKRNMGEVGGNSSVNSMKNKVLINNDVLQVLAVYLQHHINIIYIFTPTILIKQYVQAYSIT